MATPMIQRQKLLSILRGAELKDGDRAKVLLLASGPKAGRLAHIRDNPESFDGRNSAAIEIQRSYRAYATRTRIRKMFYKELGRDKMEKLYREYFQDMIDSGVDPASSEIITFRHFCEDWWNNKRHPKRVAPRLTPAQAANIIQKFWRRHIDVQVYCYYRDLINFKNRGDPAMMLRCINPQEAKLLDAAAGIHVKFRLAGDRFPPNIYYKIFTHRPIQDLCANSPLDYTSPDTRRRLPHDIHNKGNRVPQRFMEGLYKRWENNGWRLVSDRLIQHVLSDPITWESSRKKTPFQHTRFLRRKDVEKKRKQRKIDWLQKIYHDGMLKAKADDEETIVLIEGAAAGMVATIKEHGLDAVEDWEVDELLDWTTSLNYQDYVDNWQELATSANSERPICDRLNLSGMGKRPHQIIDSGMSHSYNQPECHRGSP